MKKKLHSLLIGINDYKGNDLNQCVADAKKVENYLNTLQQNKYDFVPPVVLVDDQATKSKIVSKLFSIIDSLEDGDMFLFYYSGHGTQETSNDRFIDDHNGRIQCVVCHPESGINDALLADKELRFLFSKLEAEAHVVTIFDCCHAGDITRSHSENRSEKQVRRMSVHFPPRPEQNFIFSGEVALEEFKTKKFSQIFPNKNIITLSAAASHESSWEDSKGGVFTRNLLEVLKKRNNALNYHDIAKLTRLSIQSNTFEKQTPTIDVMGDQTYNQMTSWLNLNGIRYYKSQGSINFNESEGWLYTKGSLHGVKANDKIKIRPSSNSDVEITIKEAKIDHSTLDLSQSTKDALDNEKSYVVVEDPILFKPKVFINNLDHDESLEANLKTILEENKFITYTANSEESDFDLNLFNQLVYFSFSNDAYRPLNNFYNLVEEDESNEVDAEEHLIKLENKINGVLPKIQKWHHYTNLDVKDEFDTPPISVEFSEDKGSTWKDVFNGQVEMEPKTQRNTHRNQVYNNILHTSYELKITNLTSERLYVSPIILYNGRLEIAYGDKEMRSIELDAGKSTTINQVIFLDHYMEVFNWKQECANFKFIVNNHSDLKPELPSILQDGLDEPYSLRGGKRGGFPSDDFEVKDRNAIFFTKVILKNSTFNQISGDLASQQQKYTENEIISPFIERLYFDVDSESLNLQLREKENNKQPEPKGFKVFLGNVIDHNRRKRQFKRLLKKFPNQPVILAEGDSWFLYPILVKDTLDHLMTEYPVKSLAWAGDTLENYKKSGALLKEVGKLKPKYVLISGGGNDIVGPDIVKILKEGVATGQEVGEYLNDEYHSQMKKLEDLYTYFFTEVSKSDSVEKILVHGYDYIRTDHAAIVVKGGWVSRYMIKKGITNADDRKKIIDFLIDEFNKMLDVLTAKFDKVTHVNVLNTISKDEWYDEIHPNDIGYKKVANKFKAHLT